MFFNTEEHTDDPKNQINKDSQFMVAFEQVILCESNGSKKKNA